MIDVEMTKRCAEAMGFKIVYPDQADLPLCIESPRGAGVYNPLRDDAEAMALVKHLLLTCAYGEPRGRWVVGPGGLESSEHDTLGIDLNRAIVECVSKMMPPSSAISAREDAK